jgi:hypothetical protein
MFLYNFYVDAMFPFKTVSFSFMNMVMTLCVVYPLLFFYYDHLPPTHRAYTTQLTIFKEPTSF